MAKGEKRYSSAGKDIHEFNFQPIPEDDYDLVLLADGLEMRRSKDQGPDAIPYIGCRFEALNTAAKEGQKNRLVFINFFCSLKPGSDGVIMPERGGGLAQLYRSKGVELDAPVLSKSIKKGEGENAQEEEVEYLDPETIIEQLKEWTDSKFRGHVSIEREREKPGMSPREKEALKKKPGRNKVDRWNVPEVAAPAPKAQAAGGLKKAKK